MARTGRPPIPTAIKKLKGTYREHRAPGPEPEPDSDRPSCPRWLTPYAKTAWRYYAPILHEQGTLTKADRDILVVFCEALALFREATEKLQEQDKVHTTHKGNYLQNPWLYSRKQAVQDMLKAAAELGIGAGSRTRLAVSKAENDASLADALFAAVNGD